MARLGTLIALTCVSTVMSQALGLAYLWTSGNLHGESVQQILSILRGVDMVPTDTEYRDTQERESRQLSFEAATEQRMMRSLNLTLREQVVQQGLRQLHELERSLRRGTSSFDQRRAAFKQELELLQTTAKDNGLVELRRTIENMEPALAKEQLVRMMDQGETKVVVTMVKAMPLYERNEILSEFRGAEDEMLSEILQQILEGVPETTIIDGARDQLEHGISGKQMSAVGTRNPRSVAQRD